MHKILFSFILFGLLQLSFTADSQESKINRSNNKVSLNGKSYYIHIVRKGETLFAISQEYKVPIDSLKIDNLHLSDELKLNEFIKVRIVESDKSASIQEYYYHRVVKGDTPYNISKRYSVTINDIYTHNPNAELGIAIGESIKVPLPKKVIALTDTIVKTEPIENGFIIHVVAKKETKYGIANQYKVSIEDIDNSNEGLAERQLDKGESIKIPIKNKALLNDDNFYYHKVLKQETVYGITKKYQISAKQLNKLNPELKDRGLQIDELIRVPKNDKSDVIFTESEPIEILPDSSIVPKMTDNTFFSLPCPNAPIDTISTYKVAFFIPFYLNINDTLGKFIEVKTIDDAGVEIIELIPRTGKIKDEIFARTDIFLEFYEGSLLAIQNLKEQGMSFEIHVFDTQNDSSYVDQLLNSNDLEDFNMFIGPFYSDILDQVSDYAWEHQINIISPLSLVNSFIEHNPYAFQVIPPFEIQMLHASEYLNNFETKNYIVIHDGNNLNQEYIAAFKQQLYSNIDADNFDQIKYNEVFYYDARDSVLKEVFTEGIENIVIVPSSNQAFVSDVMGKLNGYSYNYKITTFGQPRWISFDNIELESFHNTNTHIFSNSFIDYNDSLVVDFTLDFRKLYNGEPSKYAMQGYDISKYFLSALNKYGHEFRKCIHMHKEHLLQTNYNFVPHSDQGGYQNTAIYILEYTKYNKLVKRASYPEK